MRNWIETEADGWINSRDIFSIYVKKFSDDERWSVIAESKNGYQFLVKPCLDEEEAQRHLLRTIDRLEGDVY